MLAEDETHIDLLPRLRSYPVLDYFEEHGTPFIVAVNHFDGAKAFDLDEVREALGVVDAIPRMARDRDSVKEVLVTVIEQVLLQRLAEAAG